MYLSQKHLSRRTVLKGVGVTMAMRATPATLAGMTFISSELG